MRCMACDAEMILMRVVPDDTLGVAGFEHHTFMCSACHDVQRHRVFTRHGRESAAEPMPVIPHQRGDQKLASLTACSLNGRGHGS
jgi:hypothetical protein